MRFAWLRSKVCSCFECFEHQQREGKAEPKPRQPYALSPESRTLNPHNRCEKCTSRSAAPQETPRASCWRFQQWDPSDTFSDFQDREVRQHVSSCCTPSMTYPHPQFVSVSSCLFMPSALMDGSLMAICLNYLAHRCSQHELQPRFIFKAASVQNRKLIEAQGFNLRSLILFDLCELQEVSAGPHKE